MVRHGSYSLIFVYMRSPESTETTASIKGIFLVIPLQIQVVTSKSGLFIHFNGHRYQWFECIWVREKACVTFYKGNGNYIWIRVIRFDRADIVWVLNLCILRLKMRNFKTILTIGELYIEQDEENKVLFFENLASLS